MKILFKSFRPYFLLVVLTFLLLFDSSSAQEARNFFFQKLTTFNGLSSNYIQSVFQDSRGYLWIGTANGLNRYDGRNIKVYHHDPANPRSLPREDVRKITEDQDGHLWIGADFGLMELNPLTEEFKLFRHEPGNPHSLSDDHVPLPFIDSKNNLWVCTEKGIHLLNRRCQNFERFLPVSADSLRKNRWAAFISCYVEDKNHYIWCGGYRGLFRFDPVRHQWKYFPFQNKQSDWASGIVIDHDGRYWVVDSKTGLALFHPESGNFDAIPPIIFNRDMGYGNGCEWEDAEGGFWMTLDTPVGVVLYSHRIKKSILIDSFLSGQFSKRKTFSMLVYADRENKLWIGTTGGLYMIDHADQRFHSIIPVQGNCPEDKGWYGSILKLYEEPGLRMISYYFEKGLGLYSVDWKLIRYYSHIPPSDTARIARGVLAIYKDPEGIYWITTSKSLVRYDRKKNLFKAFTPPDDDFEGGKDAKGLREIVPFGTSFFYIRTREHGIYKFDVAKEQFVQNLFHHDNDPASLPANALRSLFKYKENQLIIVSQNAGVFSYNPLNNTYEVFNRHPDATINEALNNLQINHLLSGHILWLNSSYGLLKFDLQTKQFELFNSRNGLSNDQVQSSEIDDHGHIWVAHNAGISRFDSLTHTFINFSEPNGLLFQDLGSNMKKMSDGNIYIGDNERLIYFDPNQFNDNQQIPPVHINFVQVLNEPYPIIIDSITQKKTLTLHYDQDLITVDFSVLNFSHPKGNRFFYRLDPDSMWHQLNDGSVNLARLSPGKYILHVTGSNDSGLMNAKGDKLYITILPPFYQTWWFRVLIVLGILFIFYMIQRIRIHSITREEQLNTEFNKQLAQAETKALRAQMNPHFIFNSLNSINSFIVDQKHEIASDYLIKFSKLIRLILDNSRSELISLDKELETLKLYVLLENARFDNKFTCSYHVAEDVNINTIMIPPMLLQPFVENAIWHGLMQKENPGTIAIDVKKADEEYLNISITDDGIGREKAAELKSKSATHKSHGLKVTALRIDMMNKLNSTGAKVEIVDLKNDLGEAIGTRVELIIPF